MSRRAAALALGALLLVWGTAATLTLDRLGFFSGEVQTARTLALPPAELVVERMQRGHPPLYFLLLRAWSRVAGDSEVALRLPSVAFSLGALACVYALGARLAGPAAGVLAVLLVALHATPAGAAQWARPYALMELLLLLTVLLLVRALEAERVRRREVAAFGLLWSAALYTSPSSLLVGAGELAWVLAHPRLRRGFAPALLAALASYAPFALWTLLHHAALEPVAWTRGMSGHGIPALARPLLASSETFAGAWTSGAAFALLLALLLAGWQAARRRAGVLLAIWATAGAIGLGVEVASDASLLSVPRYLLVPTALAWVLVACGALRAPAGWRIALAAVAVAVSAATLVDSVARPGPRHGMRELAALVAARRLPDECVAVAGRPPLRTSFRYYAERLAPGPAPCLAELSSGDEPPPAAPDERAPLRAWAARADVAGVWLAIASPAVLAPAQAAVLEARFGPPASEPTPRGELLHYR